MKKKTIFGNNTINNGIQRVLRVYWLQDDSTFL